MVNPKLISEALGGLKTHSKNIDTYLDLSDLIVEGLPMGSALHLQRESNLSDGEYSQILGVSKSWITKYRNTPLKRIPIHVGETLYRLARIFKLAEIVLEDRQSATDWIKRPKYELCNRSPVSLIRSSAGSNKVEEFLNQIEYGI